MNDNVISRINSFIYLQDHKNNNFPYISSRGKYGQKETKPLVCVYVCLWLKREKMLGNELNNKIKKTH